MRNRLSMVLGLCTALGIAGAALPAHAQGYYAPPPPQQQRMGVLRSGFVLGGAIGVGGIFFEDCQSCEGLGGLALQFHIGGMIAPTLAIVFDGGINFHVFPDNSVLSSHTYTGMLRGFLTNNLWIGGGLGVAYLEATDEFGFAEEWHTGIAGVLAAGIEVLQTYQFTLDLQLRASGARYDDRGSKFGTSNVALLLGFNWY